MQGYSQTLHISPSLQRTAATAPDQEQQLQELAIPALLLLLLTLVVAMVVMMVVQEPHGRGTIAAATAAGQMIVVCVHLTSSSNPSNKLTCRLDTIICLWGPSVCLLCTLLCLAATKLTMNARMLLLLFIAGVVLSMHQTLTLIATKDQL
jgi:hypothetical protein